jgi:hypothetical protein
MQNIQSYISMILASGLSVISPITDQEIICHILYEILLVYIKQNFDQ